MSKSKNTPRPTPPLYVSRTVKIGRTTHVLPGTTRNVIRGLHRVARASGVEG